MALAIMTVGSIINIGVCIIIIIILLLLLLLL